MASIIKVDTIQTAAGGTPTAADLGISGSVVQVQQVLLDDSQSTTSTTYIDVTNASITITPASTSSTFVIEGCLQGYANQNASGYWQTARLQITANGTSLINESHGAGRNNISNNEFLMFKNIVSVKHSPNSTSQLVFKLQVATVDGASLSMNNFGKGYFRVTEFA